MKKTFLKISIVTSLLIGTLVNNADAQSMHFSQYYNAPMLLNPANTALMSDNDYRIGGNYRNQWATIPVPYNTFSAFADFKLFHNEERNNWLGIGGAFFNDKAGDGNLALTRIEGFVAYHLGITPTSMISAGLSYGAVQRSVNLGALTFDSQWDGFTFNKTLSNNESGNLAKTNFSTIGAGLNYAYFPNEATYIKLGVGVANINQPTESFYAMSNKIGIRPTVNLDGIFRLTEMWTLNPSVYYTTQTGAYELVYGSLLKAQISNTKDNNTSLILGVFNRFNESLIGAFGVEWNGLQVVGSYDFPISDIKPATGSYGAMEFSIIYQGLYSNLRSGERGVRTMNCPRF